MKYLLPLLLLPVAAVAQPAPAPNYLQAATGQELMTTLAAKVQAEAKVLELQAQVADLQKQLAAAKAPAPAAPPEK